MNIEIKTNCDVLYQTRNPKTAKMKFRLILGQLSGDFYPVKVIDFYEEIKEVPFVEFNEETQENETVIKSISTWQVLKETEMQIDKAKLDLLFNSVKTEIADGLSYSERQLQELRLGFLKYVQNDKLENGNCIYDLKPENFELNDDI